MIVKNIAKSKQNVYKLLRIEPPVYNKSFSQIVNILIGKKQIYLQVVNSHPTPVYLLDLQTLKANLDNFYNKFKLFIPSCRVYYSIKANYHPKILETALKHNYGLEVGSVWELQKAIEVGAKDIIYNGPGKTIDDLRVAILAKEKVIINIDSFNELKRLDELTRKFKKNTEIGIRIYPGKQKDWTKFGIPLKNIKTVWLTIQKLPYLKPIGIHFHSSSSGDIASYTFTIKSLGEYLKKEFTPDMLDSIKFIDLGGGFRQYLSSGYFPWKLASGQLFQIANNYFSKRTTFKDKYYVPKPISVREYALEISQAIKKHLSFINNCSYYLEPGKIITSTAMHIVTRVVDIKNNKTIILDGSVNLANLGSHVFDYFPVINLSHPSDKEITVDLYGSLCIQTLDIWNKYCYAEKIEIGDTILIANQGAYTYSLAQNFGRPIAEVCSV